MKTNTTPSKDTQWPHDDVCAGHQCPITDKCTLFRETSHGLTTWHWWSDDADEKCEKFAPAQAA